MTSHERSFETKQRADVPELSASKRDTLDLAGGIAARYQLSSIIPLLKTCYAAEQETVVRVAVLGRFKAGKSSFLNHLIGRELLPVGVVPVTSVVTEIGYGAAERVRIQYMSGDWEDISAERLHSYVSESENPENLKQVALVSVELPSLKHFRNISFVDTPGLESVLAHNTETSLSWLPQAGLALVAIGVDPPLSERDVALIRDLYQYTPHVSVLLTKVDTLAHRERQEVETFVNKQLQRHLDTPPPVFPYSVRDGNEDLKRKVEEDLIMPAQEEFRARQKAILGRKVHTLLHQCEDYLTLALKSAETLDSERTGLGQMVVCERDDFDETKLQLKLAGRHAMGLTRQSIEKSLQSEDMAIDRRLSAELAAAYPVWTKSLGFAIECFQTWLEASLARELRSVSAAKRKTFLLPIESIKGQFTRSLEDFQRRLSERTTRAFGVPLRSAEINIDVEDPRTPDVHIGRVLDHNWELLGILAPMWLFRGLVRRHLLNRKLPYEISKNLSRSTSQWEESIHTAISGMEKQAEARLEELMSTVESLLSRNTLEAPQIRADLENVREAQARLSI